MTRRSAEAAASSRPDRPGRPWYPGAADVDRWFHGVFEGGGAKGVAYAGALNAMAERRCWFRAVAGASAGAITAALVASGAPPDAIARATGDALARLETGVWKGLWRLRRAEGYFPSDGLHAWLAGFLAGHVAVGETRRPNGDVTFRDLYEATGIELNVVAADLSSRSQVVFSYLDTPNCVVADAVMAASAIPFAFSSRILQVPEQSGRVTHHTIVDGGVWSNLPMFVFEDRAFRRAYQRSPEEIQHRDVLGFVLAEGDDRAPVRGEHVILVRDLGAREFNAKEWSSAPSVGGRRTTGIGGRIAEGLLFPFSLLGRFVEWNGGVERGRWPPPESRLTRSLIRSLDGLLGGIHPLVLAAYACTVVAIGTWHANGQLLDEQVRVFLTTDWKDPNSYWARPVGLIYAMLLAAIGILILFATILGVAANNILLRDFRRLLYGLVATYVAGPGVPEWLARHKDNIVTLPIPPTVTTLRFRLSAGEREQVVLAARRATLARLAQLEARGPDPTSEARA